MVNAFIVCGAGLKPPTCDDYRGLLLTQCVEDMSLLIEEKKKLWVRKDYTSMFDG